jgi:GDP-mannose 6-dehydrogenase
MRAEEQARAAGWRFAVNPEFMRERFGVADFLDPGLLVFGAEDATAFAQLRMLYASFGIRPRLMRVAEACMVKYACNALHAAKVVFANEVAAICEARGVDADAVMEAVRSDGKLNTSGMYLHPGDAYGGACLPKDVAALLWLADRLPVPMLRGMQHSNHLHTPNRRGGHESA